MSSQSNEFDRICDSKMIKLAIIYILNQKKTRYTTSVSAMAELINSIIYEKQKLIIKEDGINICKSLFIPYNIMSNDNLSDVNMVLTNFENCDFFVDSDGKNNIIYPDHKFPNKTISICNVVCGFFLSVKEMFKGDNEAYLTALFDSVVSNVVFEQRVEFPVIIKRAIEYGYIPKSKLINWSSATSSQLIS